MKYQLTLADILNITDGQLIFGEEQTVIENFSRDTREINIGDVYLGIKGEKMNGSIFFEEALKKGAKGAILQEIQISDEIQHKYKDKFIILVEDTVKFMQEVAKYKRSLYNIPTVAITGSVGKTSTRDIIASVLSTKYKTLKTEKNYNNHIGVPLTLFKLKNEEALAMELGMNHLGEISKLTKIVQPTIAVITNIGTAHIGNLGSRENILKAKLEILEGLDKNGYVVVNNDDDLLNKWCLENKNEYKIITYGINNNSDFMPENINLEERKSTYTLKGEKEVIEVPVAGAHFILNSLCAIAVGKILNIPIDKIKEGIKKLELTSNRMEIRELNNGIIVINDYYNANYDSMKAAIEYLGKVNAKRKIAILGDMLELGEFSEQLHKKVGEEVGKNKIDVLITVGNEARYIAEKANPNIENIIECKTNQKAIEVINKIKKEGDYILLKASNGMKFGEIYDGMRQGDVRQGETGGRSFCLKALRQMRQSAVPFCLTPVLY